MNINIEPETLVTLPIFGGFSIDETMITSAIVMGIMVLFALIVRIFVIPRFREKPGSFQLLLEMFATGMDGMSRSNLGDKLGVTMAPYAATIGVFIAMSGIIELFGLRAPCADINMTAALALMSFLLINFFAFKGGIKKALHHYKPYAISPIILITDFAVPISLACRLFGNMLAGLVVMELIYSVVPLVVPAALSLYFSLFHALLQAYIFVTLTLSFIHERAE